MYRFFPPLFALTFLRATPLETSKEVNTTTPDSRARKTETLRDTKLFTETLRDTKLFKVQGAESSNENDTRKKMGFGVKIFDAKSLYLELV